MASQINASNSGFGGIVSTGDSSGILQLQAAGTTIATIQSTGLNLSSNGLVFSDSSTQTAAASPYVLKNRIINGDMRIDQRNAGASVTPVGVGGTYTLDRWVFFASAVSKYTTQQNAGSVTPPVGFTNYIGITSSSAYSVSASDNHFFGQKIEGYNVADLAWGTANAKTVTLSFQVYSSLTGTFGGAITNSNQSRSYPFTYTISSANTWTQISVTIPGDTSGTWNTGNSTGLWLDINIGTGTTYSGTAGTWASTTYVSATGTVNLIGTNGATLFITGVQLEIGTSATPFERRLYNQELANCQRYFEKSYNQGTAIGSATATAQILMVPVLNVSSLCYTQEIYYKVNKRTTPTITTYGYNGSSGQWYTGVIGSNEQLGNTTAINSSENGFSLAIAYTVTPTGAYGHYASSAEL